MTTSIIGLKNCDGCRKARRWFDERGFDYRFEEIRDDAVLADVLDRLRTADDWARFVNRRSTTWRTLTPAQRDGLDRARAIDLLAAHPTLIKRPVIVAGDTMLAGFDAAAIERALG